MTEKEITALFKKTGAILEGHFKLSSGLHSGKYLQCARLLQYPEYAESLCGALAAKFTDEKVDVVVAPALGGILVSYGVARALGARSIFTERVGGKMTLRRGFELKKTDNVLVVEDVVTTGLSTEEVVEVVKSHNAGLIGLGCLVDRSKGKIGFKTRFESLLRIDIPVFGPESCPFCREKIPITKPGSR